MAREISEIKNKLCSDFVENTTIQSQYNLTSGLSFDEQFSKVSFESILFYIIAVSIWVFEKLFDEHKIWIEAKAKEMQIGTSDWYRKKALEFQIGSDLINGEPLVYSNDKYEYATIDTTKQIVKLASVSDEADSVLMKVASLDSNSLPIKLTTTQLTAFNAYIKKVKFAGVTVYVVSRDADLLKIQLHVYINSLILDENGALLSDGTTKPVEKAINNYIQTLPFDGNFSKTELVDYLQKVEGVLNPVIDSAEAKFGLGTYQPIQDYYNPNAGYLMIDPAFPLATTITYILQ